KAQFTQSPCPLHLTNTIRRLVKRLCVTEAPLPQGKGDSDRSWIFMGGKQYYRVRTLWKHSNCSRLLESRLSITRGLGSLVRVFRELRIYLLREPQKENLNDLRRNFMELSQTPVSASQTFDHFPNLFDEGAFLAIERFDLDSHLFRYL